mgnify:FL=1
MAGIKKKAHDKSDMTGGKNMGAWSVKALDSDEGLDVIGILTKEYVPKHPIMDMSEIIELMKEKACWEMIFRRLIISMILPLWDFLSYISSGKMKER